MSSKDAPIRKFCAELVAFWLRRKGAPEKVTEAFNIEGFSTDFVKVEQSPNQEDCYIGNVQYICDDPRRRGEREQWSKEVDEELSSGYPICYFHVHQKQEGKCSSGSNRAPYRESAYESCGHDLDYSDDEE